MRKVYLLLLLLCNMCIATYSQVAGYQFSQSSGTYNEITGGTVLGSSSNDDEYFLSSSSISTTTVGTGFPIGFNFTLAGIVFNQVGINNNGWISLGQSSLGTSGVNMAATTAYSPLSSTSTISPSQLRHRISAFGLDLQGNANSELSFLLRGSAPNRQFVVQYKNYNRYSATGPIGDILNFQIILNEGTNVIQIVYGNNVLGTGTSSASNAQIGIGGASSSDYIARQTVTPHNWNTTFAATSNSQGAAMATSSIASTAPANGLTFTFTPPPPCISPIAQPTGLVLNPGSQSVGISFTAASPASQNYMVVRTTTSTSPTPPVNGTIYTIGSSALGGVIDFVGAGTNAASTGLTPNTQYFYWVYSVNNQCTGGPIYLATSPLSGSTTTVSSATITSTTTGGLWSVSTTWVNGLVPSAADNVTIVDGASVTVDVSPIVNNLTVGQGTSGVLNFDATTGRTLTVNGNFTTTAGSTFSPFNGTTGRGITVNGNVVLNGSSDFSQTSTSLVMSGTTVQTFSGTGSLGQGNPFRLLAVSNPAGVTLLRPLTVTSTLNLVQGVLTNGTNLTIDNTIGTVTTTTCAIQRGVGSLNAPIQVGSTATFNVIYLAFTGITNAAVVAGNELPASGTINALTINNPLGVTLNSNLNLSAASTAITLTSGILTVTGSNAISCTNVGYNGVAGSAASHISGKFGLSWGTSATKTYPIGSLGQLRTVVTTASIGSGVVAFSIVTPNGGTPGTDIAALTNTRRWLGEVLSGTITSYSTISIAYGTDDGFGSSTNASRRIGASTTLGGAYNSLGPATGTSSPLVSTSGTYTSVGFYALGVNTGTLPITWTGGAGTNNWGDAGNWSNNTVPTASTDVLITGNVNITTNVAAVANTLTTGAGSTVSVAANSLTITGASTTGASIGGTLQVNGGSVVIGPVGGGNRNLTVTGTLNISSGDITVNGNTVFSANSNFTMSGGTYTLDPNDGTASGSVANAIPTLTYGSSGVFVNSNITGGTLLFNDPPFAGSALSFSAGLASGSSAAWTGGTVQFGGTTNTHPSTNSVGFGVDLYINSGRLRFNNVIINGNDPTKFVSDGTYGINVANTLTINANSELRIGTTFTILGANIVNNGTLTTTSTPTFATIQPGSTSVIANPNPQSIGGTGVFRNSTVTNTASMAALTINNSSSTGVTLNTPLSIAGTLTLTNGVVNTTTTNILTLGASTSLTGTLVRTNGWINGPMRRWHAAATTSGQQGQFPTGTATQYRPTTITYTTAPTTGGTITAQFVASASGANGLPLTDGSVSVTNISQDGYWTLTAGDGLAGGTFSLATKATGFTGIQAPTALRIVRRADAASAWLFEGTHAVGLADSTANRTGFTNLGHFTIASEASANTLPVTFTKFTGERKGTVNQLSWITSSELNNAGFNIERSVDGINFTKLTFVASKALNGTSNSPLTYMLTDVIPFIGTNYYRLQQIDKDGKISYSQVVRIASDRVTNFSLQVLYPNPVENTLNAVIAAPKANKISLVIMDMGGKILLQTNQQLVAGDNTIQVPVQKLQAGTYLIKAICNDGCETMVKQFIKN